MLQTIDAENEDNDHSQCNEPKPLAQSEQNSAICDVKKIKSHKPKDSTLPCCPKCCCQCMDHGPFEAEQQTKSLDSKLNKPKKYKLKSRNCMITGGVELVPLLAKRRALQRPISLATTDVTKCQDKKLFSGYN